MKPSLNPNDANDRGRIRELHHLNPFWTVVQFCNACEEDWPCTMIRLLDQYEAMAEQNTALLNAVYTAAAAVKIVEGQSP